MGACHWGLSMANYGITLKKFTNHKRYALSTLPSLLGFFSLLVPHVPIQIGLQLIGFNSLLVADWYAHYRGLTPHWYLGLRYYLTLVVSLSMGGTLYLVYDRNQRVSIEVRFS
jgi:hypothetical protein